MCTRKSRPDGDESKVPQNRSRRETTEPMSEERKNNTQSADRTRVIIRHPESEKRSGKYHRNVSTFSDFFSLRRETVGTGTVSRVE